MFFFISLLKSNYQKYLNNYYKMILKFLNKILSTNK